MTCEPSGLICGSATNRSLYRSSAVSFRGRTRRTTTTRGYAKRLMVFVAVAVITALLYAEWVVWVPLLPDNLYTPLLDLGKITGYRWSSAIVYLLIVLSLYGLYAAGYWQLASRRVSIRTAAIFGAGALFCA